MKNKKWLYYLNYEENYKNLCDLEMNAMFGFIPQGKSFITSKFINPSRSIFIKGCITISYYEDALSNLVKAIQADQLSYQNYKINFIKSDYNDVSYKERLRALRVIGFSIEGDFALHNPDIELALTKINNMWIFGKYLKNDHTWLERKQKPFNYSYALDHKLAQSLINIAVGDNLSLTVVDPCCGIGTVIIEGRELGIKINGFDINPNIVAKCNKNLRNLGFDDDVKSKNILDINNIYDVAIVDLPYGKFSKTSHIEQKLIIKKTKQIAQKAIFVSMFDLNPILTTYGFKIKATCFVRKSDNFGRYITVCSEA